MKCAIFIVLCEGEYEIAWEALASLCDACREHQLEVFIVDDGSPSRVGKRLGDRISQERGLSSHVVELEKSLGYRGTSVRTFMGLERIVQFGRDTGTNFDVMVKIDSDALVVRQDLGAFIKASCPDRRGLFGEQRTMRWRDRLLYLADQLPLGFARETKNGVIEHRWKLGRTRPVWWSDLGRRALLRGFHFDYIPGGFWFLGGDTLRELDSLGMLSRDQSSHGFVFNDDLLVTTAVMAIGHPVVSLASLGPGWGTTLSMSERTPFEVISRERPYVVHPLKDNPKAWQRREELRAHFAPQAQ